MGVFQVRWFAVFRDRRREVVLGKRDDGHVVGVREMAGEFDLALLGQARVGDLQMSIMEEGAVLVEFCNLASNTVVDGELVFLRGLVVAVAELENNASFDSRGRNGHDGRDEGEKHSKRLHVCRCWLLP